MQPGIGQHGHAFFPESCFHRSGQVFITLRHDVIAPLNQRDKGPDTLEELRQFQGHGPAAEHDHGWREVVEFQGVVAGEIADLFESGYRDAGNHGPRGNDKRLGCQFVRARLDFVRRKKRGAFLV